MMHSPCCATHIEPELEWDPYDRNCPSRQVLDRVGDRWTVLVVGALAQGPWRFKELAERVDGVAQKMPTQTLRSLERDGLVTRTMYAQLPPRVEYQLTDAGGGPACDAIYAEDDQPSKQVEETA